ncbi:hypothetical protein ACIRRH_41155 [Kitasatospora sp. NPDC101235]|uniref:hypothetical protein n=1 Tax=Kitasatospora sp. NPDC101235 TaxID=3364101 RepID=UPI003812B723
MPDTAKTVIARYQTVGGATVDLTPEPRGIRATCTGCPNTNWLSHYDLCSNTADRAWATNRAVGWAQRHAETCRAMPLEA